MQGESKEIPVISKTALDELCSSTVGRVRSFVDVLKEGGLHSLVVNQVRNCSLRNSSPTLPIPSPIDKCFSHSNALSVRLAPRE